ncbi:hypothetical protein NZJ93_00775 [Desulfofundulus thermocisternus]|nr:hypothetical protein [Desulfofundulus thermocisternus]
MPSWATTTTTSAKKREESGSAPGRREELHEMTEALPDGKVAEARDLLCQLFNGKLRSSL